MPNIQPFIALVGCLQVVGGFYSLFRGDWKMFVINIGVGLANAVLSTMGKS